jgi:hypothetical protein
MPHLLVNTVLVTDLYIKYGQYGLWKYNLNGENSFLKINLLCKKSVHNTIHLKLFLYLYNVIPTSLQLCHSTGPEKITDLGSIPTIKT